MRWDSNRQSDNVEDRRGEDAGPGGGGFGFGGRHIGIGTVVVALLAGWAFGINPLTVLSLLSGGGPLGSAPSAPAPPRQAGTGPRDPMVSFVSFVLRDTEDVWTDLFQRAGGTYRKPKLDIYRGAIATACGSGQTAMGPFYCPGDEKIYIDLTFYDTLRQQLGSPGDFAQAYVIAHEVGHHVQKLTGVTDRVDAARDRMSKVQANALSVRVELQADCYAGVWAYHAQAARQIIEQGDIEEALNAASHIGDDALQRQAQGRVVPETFTHGTSAQRVNWFRRGLSNGRVQDCDTFDAKPL
jgi:predicted metalloprotease